MNTATSWISAVRCKPCIYILETENKHMIYCAVQRVWKVFYVSRLGTWLWVVSKHAVLQPAWKPAGDPVFASDSKHWCLLQAWTSVCLCTLTPSFICKWKRPSCQCCVVKKLSVCSCSVSLAPGCRSQFSAALHWLQSDTSRLRWR